MNGKDGERLPEPLIVVGSTNPTKVEAARRICQRAWPGCRVEGIDVPSGVPAQPIGEEETLAGARQRARGALARRPRAWLGIGLEGGVDRTGHLLAACCVVDDRGRENAAWGLRMPLPDRVARAVLAGEELGPLLERLSGRSGIRRGEGAVGLFTTGLIDRTRLWETAVAGALAPWLAPEWYRPDDEA
ncbi:MAG TPA: inosine/xanthosine triphosphatase [Thermaerobacter sp.]